MRIPDADLDDFIIRWKNAFGEDLTRNEASIRANELLELFTHLFRKPDGEQRGSDQERSDPAQSRGGADSA